eukprot:gnl/TRDRNA2_/TRDRNA2_127570_c0_seq1.p1 gnl/TRDRNA2_/TRDRNA2_127570_c0~~gnl/TRDRNA2_/TRDRNA2_127570_c0_seq1.p1  ORF type:complete len:420 (+),score=66.20 gnl/TRDRNA2_/TRDRNA2_127570_c0_seq1:130-1260(+)
MDGHPLRPVWDHMWHWMKGGNGSPPAAAAPAGVSRRAQLVQTIWSKNIGDEQKRIGAAYQLGAMAKYQGDMLAVEALLEALLGHSDEEKQRAWEATLPQDLETAPPAMASHQRAGLWGLAAAGDAGVASLLSLLSGPSSSELSVEELSRAACALGEACETPTVAVAEALVASICRLRAEVVAAGGSGLDEEQTKKAWLMSAFARKKFRLWRGTPACRALDVAAQAMWNVAQRAVVAQMRSHPDAHEVICRLQDAAVDLMAVDRMLTPRSRSNASYTLLCLAHALHTRNRIEAGEDARCKAMRFTLAEAAAQDNDRYVMAAAAYALRRLDYVPSIDSPLVSSAASILKPVMQAKEDHADALLNARWCPVTERSRTPF